jgi:ubiquinol-cytochrome c reductase cytochrome c1 subunit
MSTLLKIMLLGCLSMSAFAEEAKLEKIQVPTDKASIAKGAEDWINNCLTCHTMKYVKYRDLLSLGMDKVKVDGLRGEASLDTPLTAQMTAEVSMATFAKIPPDLSLMAQARDGGPNYVYSYLIGYYVKPDGSVGNHVFPETKMPDPLGISSAANAAERAEKVKTAKSITTFLTWAADPHAGERDSLGKYVIAYLIVLSALLYVVKKQIWSRLK